MKIKLVLFYYSVRSHLSSTVLNMFKEHNITVNALPAQTINRLKPVDVSLFQPFKKAV